MKKKPSSEGVVPSQQKLGIQTAGGQPDTPPPASMWPLMLVVGSAVLLTGGAIAWRYWPADGPAKDERVEQIAALLAPFPKLDGLKQGDPPPKSTRDAARAAAMLTAAPLGWGKKLDDGQIDELLAHAALSDERLVVTRVRPAEKAGVYALRTDGTVVSQFVETDKGPAVFTLQGPAVLVRSEGDKVRPLGLAPGTRREARLLGKDEALIHRFALWTLSGDKRAREMLPAAPAVPDQSMSEAEADVWSAAYILTHPDLRVVKVSPAAKGAFKMETKCKINPPLLRIREKDGRVVNSSQSRFNPDVIVEVRGGKIHALAVE